MVNAVVREVNVVGTTEFVLYVLLRQYFPKDADLSLHSQAELDRVAAELNGRPRETLKWRKPVEELDDLIAKHMSP